MQSPNVAVIHAMLVVPNMNKNAYSGVKNTTNLSEITVL